MEVRDIRNERLGLKMVKNLERRNFEAYYCPTASDACEKVLSLIPEGSSISWGGSMTIRDIGLTKKLHEGNYTVIDRDLAKNDEEKNDCYLKAFSCDYYLSSSNAISEDGVIVNIDGNGNRVAAITWGPKRVIFMISTASPINAARFNIDTPCQADGRCHNCNSPESICNYIHLLRNSHPSKRHIVVLIGEPLGY